MKEKRFRKELQKEMTVCKRFLYNHKKDQHRVVSEKLEPESLARGLRSLRMFRGNTL